jgi:outer membrane protein W
MRHTKSLFLAVLLTALPLRAETAIGARISVDRISELQSSLVGADLFVRTSIGRTLAIEVDTSYRSNSTSGIGGLYRYSITTNQFPIVLGIVYLPIAGHPVRPWVGAGLVVAPEFSSTTYSPGDRSSYSSVLYGVHASAGVQASIGEEWLLDAGVRYIPPMGSSRASQMSYSFVRVQAGIARQF